MTDERDKDPKVKALVERDPSEPLERFVDAETAAQLERWFGLPSFAQVEAGEVPAPPPPPEDPYAEVRERRRKLLADVDMNLVETIENRHAPRDISMFTPSLEPYDGTIGLVDVAYAETRASLADERWCERPGDIVDALAESAPQALLRDLHRLETEFSRSWGSQDDWMYEAAKPEPLLVDISEKVDAIMRIRYRMERIHPPDIAHLLDETRADIDKSWVDVANSGALYNRRVTE